MVPTIFVKDGEAKLAIGGAGGSQITTAAAQVIFHYFYRGLSLDDSINQKRIHHQYMPNSVVYEDGFDSVSSICKASVYVGSIRNVLFYLGSICKVFFLVRPAVVNGIPFRPTWAAISRKG